jgi:ribosomal subunit interface protein
MDIVIKGRNVEVPEHYRALVSEKLARLERYDKKIIRYDVELFHEPNPRLAKVCQRVEITGKGRGPAVRAEASAGDFYAALDTVVNKLESRMRKSHDRRRVHYGRRCPESLATAVSPAVAGQAARVDASSGNTALLEAPVVRDVESMVEVDWSMPAQTTATGQMTSEETGLPHQRWAEDNGPGLIAREKMHSAKPITVDQALSQMELVGHDFFLFNDSEAGRPSVVYRRKGFDYGVIRLG